MKKRFSVFTLALVGFLMMAVGVYGATNWAGSDNVTNIKYNLDQISLKIEELKDSATNEQGQTIREIEILLEQEKGLREQRERELVNKQTEIDNKQTEIQDKIDEINQKIAENNKLIEENNQLKEKANKVDGLTAEVEKLKTDSAILVTENNSLQTQLDQALKDVQDIEAITKAMINE